MENNNPTKKKYALIIKCCAGCAAKLEVRNILIQLDGENKRGQCAYCGGFYYLDSYDISPRRSPHYKARTGGGERSRAGRK